MNKMTRTFTEMDQAYSISQISEITNVPPTTIRSWEQSLGEAFPVSRDPQNNRFYTARHIYLIEEINRLREEDLSLASIRKLLIRKREADPDWDEQEGRKYYSSSDDSESEEPSQSLSIVERTEEPTDQSISILQQIQAEKEMFDYRITQFFDTLSTMLEEQKEFVTTEIDRAISELDEKHNSTNEKIEERIKQQLAGREEQLQSKLAEMIKEVTSRDQEKIAATIKKEFAEWALISKEEIETRNANKGFFSRLFNKK